MRNGYQLGIAAVVIAFEVYAFAAYGFFSAAILAAPVTAFAVLAYAVGRFFAVRNLTLAERLQLDSSRALVILLGVVASAALAPWIIGLTTGDLGRFLSLACFIPVLAGAFFAARQVTGGWAFLWATSVIVGCVWMGMFSLLLAYRLDWGQLAWKDPEDGLDGTGFGIAVTVVMGSMAAPLLGFLIAIASQPREKDAAVR